MNPDSIHVGAKPDSGADVHSVCDTETHNDTIRRNAFLICCLVVIVIKIWLVLAFGLRAAGSADADDRLFLVLAEHILDGDWLGPYDRFTLAKGPFFPIWIAFAFLANIPLTLSYQLLHVGACAIVLFALKPCLPSRRIRLALFVILLFDPSTYSAMASWVIREGIYISLTMIVLACAIALLLRLNRGPRAMLGWSIGLGFALVAFWSTREEGAWVLPAALIALAYALVAIWRSHDNMFSKSIVLVLPAIICAAGVYGVCAQNKFYYGVFEMVDFKSAAFERANGALMRVKHEQWNQFANVPKEVRIKIYEVSPAFSELRDFLEGPPGQAWGRGAEIWLVGGTPSPEDIRGGFFVWALRHAVHQRGYYRRALDAEAFYTRLADEIDSACDDRRLECGPKRATLTPPWRPAYASLVIQSFWKGLRMMSRLDEVSVMNMPSQGPQERMLIFEDLGRTRINPLMGDTGESPRLRNQARMDRYRFRVLGHLNYAYKAVAPYVTGAAVIGFLLVFILEFSNRSFSPIFVILILLVASFMARMAILSLISITSFDAMKLRYFLPLYPILILFCFLSLVHAAHVLHRRTNFGSFRGRWAR